MLRQAPPLEAVEIFVAAAKGGSFRSVAHDLALSPSAVSRRIAALERFLGIALFDRRGQACTLSLTGERYLAMVEPAISAIKRAGSALSEPHERLRIAASHSLTSTWLLPRLGELQRACGFEVEVVATRDLATLRSGEAHLAIWGSVEPPSDVTAERLCEAPMVPACAPMLLDALEPRGGPARSLLEVKAPARSWERWLAMAGLEPPQGELRQFDTLQLTYEAAAAGLGICLVAPLTGESFLRAGKLVPCGERHAIGESYYIYRLARRTPPTAHERRFLDWVRNEAALSCEAFRGLSAPASARSACSVRPRA